MAVKILIKRRFKEGNMRVASRLLINHRKGAMKRPGYISSETLRSIDDPSQVVVVSMWDSLEAWQKWKNSKTRKANEAEFKDLLVGETKFEYYSLGLPLE